MGSLKTSLLALVVGVAFLGAAPQKAEAYTFGSYAYDLAYDTYQFTLYGIYDDIAVYGDYSDNAFNAYYSAYFGYLYAEYGYFYDYGYMYDASLLLSDAAFYSDSVFFNEGSSFYFYFASIYGDTASLFALYSYYFGFYGL